MLKPGDDAVWTKGIYKQKKVDVFCKTVVELLFKTNGCLTDQIHIESARPNTMSQSVLSDRHAKIPISGVLTIEFCQAFFLLFFSCCHPLKHL